MGTKIYNGMILRDRTLGQALAWLRAIRPDCLANMQTAVASEICKRLVFYKDLAMNYRAIDQKIPDYWTVVEQIREAKVTTLGTGTRAPDWDYTLEVCLITHGADVLVLHYMENNAGYLATLKTECEDFHYQNQSDRPDSISPEDWERRRQVWNEVLPGVTSPVEVGLTYSLVSWPDIANVQFEQDLVKVQMPTDDQRRQEVAARLTEMEVVVKQGASGLLELLKAVKKQETVRRPSVLLCENPF